MRVRRLPPFTYLSFYIPFYTQDPHMDLRGARRFFASCAGPRLGLQSLCLLMSLRCCLCSPSALEPRTLALPFSRPLLPFSLGFGCASALRRLGGSCILLHRGLLADRLPRDHPDTKPAPWGASPLAPILGSSCRQLGLSCTRAYLFRSGYLFRVG